MVLKKKKKPTDAPAESTDSEGAVEAPASDPEPIPDMPPVEESLEPAPAEPKPDPTSAPEPLRPSGVPFRVFKTISGIRSEHIAGFANFVTRHKLGPMTVPAWRETYERFLQSPVK